jgi:hypothetical protein
MHPHCTRAKPGPVASIEEIKQSRLPLSVPMYDKIFKTTRRILMWSFLIDKVIQGEDFHVYNMYNIPVKDFSISIKPE